MTKTFYFIGGGYMVEAIISALRKNKEFSHSKIYVEEIEEIRLEHLVKTYAVLKSHNSFIPQEEIDLLILGVRPQDDLQTIIRSVSTRFSQKTTLLSILAGVTIKKIETYLAKEKYPIVRIIPNTLTTTRYGYSGVTLNPLAKKETVESFLTSFGKILYVEERYLDIITGFYPPNIVYHLLDAYIDAGVLSGLPREVAQKIAYDNLIGAVDFLNQEQVLPKELLNRNNSPGGIGIRLAYELNQNNFAGGIQTAILAAVQRTTELGGTDNE